MAAIEPAANYRYYASTFVALDAMQDITLRFS
jgi:hypothetical protein